ncbi:MAG: hypothetical protein ACREP5_13075 [Candidatus Binatia bacterium]
MNATVPSDLLKLKAQFEHWRKTRSNRSRIPAPLRQAAIDLLDRYSASAICRACRLHPHVLKPPAVSKPRARKPTTTTAQVFFPLPAAEALPPASWPHLAQADCRLVLERPDGARLTLALPRLEATTLETLCSNFLCSSRP